MNLPAKCPKCQSDLEATEHGDILMYTRKDGVWVRKTIRILSCTFYRPELMNSKSENIYCDYKQEFTIEPEIIIPEEEYPKVDLSIKDNFVDRTPRICSRKKCKKSYIPDYDLQSFCSEDCVQLNYKSEDFI